MQVIWLLILLLPKQKDLSMISQKFVAEFNEAHRFGVDLEGAQGKDFFSLDAVEITKISKRDSTAQLRVDGNLEKLMGSASASDLAVLMTYGL